jgi:transcriptional regulator with XRE-family HTH domain
MPTAAPGILTRRASFTEAAMDGKELKRKRLAKGIDLFTLAERLGLDPVTLSACEEGELRLADSLAAEWERAIDRAPNQRGWLRRIVSAFSRKG